MEFGQFFNQTILVPNGQLSELLGLKPGEQNLSDFFYSRAIYLLGLRNAIMDCNNKTITVLVEELQEIQWNWQEDASLWELNRYNQTELSRLTLRDKHILQKSLTTLWQVYTQRADQTAGEYKQPAELDAQAEGWTQQVIQPRSNSKTLKSSISKRLENEIYIDELTIASKESRADINWSSTWKQVASTLKGIACNIGLSITPNCRF